MTAPTTPTPAPAQTDDTSDAPTGRAPGGALHGPVIAWFDEHARDLPWRRPEAGPWGVMVSEFMLQQTPVNAAARLRAVAHPLRRPTWPRNHPARPSAPGAAWAIRVAPCACTAQPWP